MSDPRYGLASRGALTYALESDRYEQEDDPDTEFGITSEDIDPSNENPQTGLPHGGGGRSPYVLSPDPKEHGVDATSVLHTPDAPLEIAVGERTETDEGDYTAYVFSEADRLPTATIRHIQTDLDFVAYYVGCKADLSIEWSLGDPVELGLDITAAAHEFDPEESPPAGYEPTLPTDISPYRGHMQGHLTLTDSGDDSIVTEVATVNGGSVGINNGLEPQHHGGDGEGPERDAYSIAETTNDEGKYDVSFDLNVVDHEYYNEAVNGNRLLDMEIPLVREYDDALGEIVDGLIIRGEEGKITNAPAPIAGEGVVEGEIEMTFQGGLEFEIREAA